MLAVAGGAVHSAPAHLVSAYNRLRVMSKATHKIMLHILEARNQAERVIGFASPDDNVESENPWIFEEDMYVPHPRSGEG